MPTNPDPLAPQLTNPSPDPLARIAMISLPVPCPESESPAPPPNALGHLPTQIQPVGWWPHAIAHQRRATRRQLMFALSSDPLPDTLQVATQPDSPADYTGPQLESKIISKKNTGVELTEFNEAVFNFSGKSLGLRLGVRHDDELHFWQWIRIETLWSGPLAKAVRIAGYIEVQHHGDDTYGGMGHVTSVRHVHVQNWLRADVYAIMFANGVIQLTIRHINNHMFDEGRDQHDALPLIALTTPNPPDINQTLDGANTQFDLAGIKLNLDDAARAVSPDQPGSLTRHEDLILYQPYAGVEIRGDNVHYLRDDDHICKIEDDVFPRGAARTIRFNVALGDAPPRIARYVAPDWWYAHCREFWPDPCLPARADLWQSRCDKQHADATQRCADRPTGFDAGIDTADWEGETPYKRMLWYYHTGQPIHHHIAVNDAYHLADIAFDHATETIRMVGYPFGAIALPLFRTVGLTFGHLETGDPYLLECAESAANHYYWIDTHNWPRRSYGRDAMSLRSLIFLWDYTDKDHYIHMVRDALARLITCQRPNGSYGDQGQTVGIHGPGNEITKVWMAMMANAPIIDYLLRTPDDPELWAAAKRTGDFLLEAELHNEGQYGWGYEYKYGDNPGNPFEMIQNPENFNHYPPQGARSYGYEDRFLSVVSQHTGDPAYLEAWLRFFATHLDHLDVQFTPYAHAHAFNARLESGDLHIQPDPVAVASVAEADIPTPVGAVHIRCAVQDAQLTIETRSHHDFPITAHPPHNGPAVTMTSNDSTVLQ